MSGEERHLTTEDALERILRHAPPRRMPPPQETEQVRRALHAEWLAVTRRRRARRFLWLASAASLALALGVLTWLSRVPGTPSVAVATIEKSIGAIYLLGERSELTKTGELSILAVGQAVVTGPASGAALSLTEGGQLRLAENTRIELVAGDTVFLESGRVYFDSKAPILSGQDSIDEAGSFVIRTDRGAVAHAGTQFVVERSGQTLIVRVREGEVEIDGDYHDLRGSAGQEIILEGRSQPVVVTIASHGDAWSWVEAATPPTRVDDPSIHQFLTWVARETGLRLRFATPDAERTAREGHLIGRIDRPPMEALRLWMTTVDLEWQVREGVIVISER